MKKLLRVTKIVINDNRIPKWLKACAGFAILPIPGPIDEIVLIFCAVVLSVFFRPVLKEAWNIN
jgi:hypothetical protein